MKKIIWPLLAVLLSLNLLFAADAPKREFRGVWLSTVSNIDWPVSKYDSDSKKQNDLKNYLVKMKDTGINSVLMQVRCSCDAMYKSDIEPWSYWFSGQQGQGPSIDWDPLTFAVKEAHDLGLELHAWVNPYRAVVSPSLAGNSSYLSDDHVTKQHPDWILKFSDVWILDPGLPEVREYITDVLMDIVNRYDVDGLHMDDYFYPYSVITTEDSATFANYSRGFENIRDWRRDNINLLVEAVMDSINEVKPWVKWGISPFGIYRPGVPSGISGMDAYNTLYCDPLAWLAAQTVDYITPQCYWPFGGGQDYGKLIPWWAQQAYENGRHFYPGQGLYRAGSWSRGEVPRQIRLNRETDHCDGSVFFTANDFYANDMNTIDSMKLDLYRYPALWPVMTWKDSTAPAMPENIQLVLEGDGSKTISWDAPAYTDPADSGYAYVIYRSPSPVDLSSMSNALDIQFDQDHIYEDIEQGVFYYAVSALDRNKLESPIEAIKLDFTDPLLPEYAARRIPVNMTFKWAQNPGATQYTLEIIESSSQYTPVQQYTLSDTSKEFLLDYDTQYSWRVKADNSTYWSPTWVFTTQLAPQVQSLRPFAYQEGLELSPRISWQPFEDAASYDLQVSENEDMSDPLVDETGISDTTYGLSGLSYASTYYWHVRSNKYDRWSEVSKFVTKEEHMSTLWENSAITHTLPAFLDTGMEASGLAYGTLGQDEVLLVLQGSGNDIRVDVLDPQSGEPLPLSLDLSGISGGLHALRDIEISEDGVIYASNCTEESDTFKVYQWTDPAQAATCVYQAEDVAYRFGDHIGVRGRLDDGSISIYAPASSHFKLLKLTWNNVSSEFEGEQISLDRLQREQAAVAFIPGIDGFFVNSEGFTIRIFSDEGKTQGIMGSDNDMPSRAHALDGFKYNDKPYLVSYSQTTESAYIVDIFGGVLTALSAGNTYKLGLNQNASASGDVDVRDNGDGTFTIFVLGNQNGIGAYEFDAASAMVAVADESMPVNFGLGQNYPNPFNPVTMIPYTLQNAGNVEISIYDLKGRRIRTLYSGYQTAGSYELKFNAADLSSGMYICAMKMNDRMSTQKMTLLK